MSRGEIAVATPTKFTKFTIAIRRRPRPRRADFGVRSASAGAHRPCQKSERRSEWCSFTDKRGKPDPWPNRGSRGEDRQRREAELDHKAQLRVFCLFHSFCVLRRILQRKLVALSNPVSGIRTESRASSRFAANIHPAQPRGSGLRSASPRAAVRFPGQTISRGLGRDARHTCPVPANSVAGRS